jgi:probable phosphoglycerate mutase
MFVILHGQTEWNRDGRLQGQSDSPLTDFGREQSRSAARTLLEIAGSGGICNIVSSPLGRTQATANIIASTFEQACAPIRLDERLKEMRLGRWEGLTREEIAERFGDLIAGTTREDVFFRAPGGESYSILAARLRSWLDSIDANGDVVAVTHGIASRVLRGIYLGLDPSDSLRLPLTRDRVLRLQHGSETLF